MKQVHKNSIFILKFILIGSPLFFPNTGFSETIHECKAICLKVVNNGTNKASDITKNFGTLKTSNLTDLVDQCKKLSQDSLRSGDPRLFHTIRTSIVGLELYGYEEATENNSCRDVVPRDQPLIKSSNQDDNFTDAEGHGVS